METSQLTTSLRRCFKNEGHRLVFWYDADCEFEGALTSLDLDRAEILRLDEIGSLAHGFASHKGYGSRQHRDAVIKYGPCLCHRRSFAGVKEHCERP